MKYIPLDEVISTIVNYYPINHSGMELEDFISKIYSIKTIDLSIIDEMIEEATAENGTLTPFPIGLIVGTLRKLKERLSLNK